MKGQAKRELSKLLQELASNHTDSFCMSTVIKNDLLLNRTEIITTAQDRFQNGITSYEGVRSNIRKYDQGQSESKAFLQSSASFYDFCLPLPPLPPFILLNISGTIQMT